MKNVFVGLALVLFANAAQASTECDILVRNAPSNDQSILYSQQYVALTISEEQCQKQRDLALEKVCEKLRKSGLAPRVLQATFSLYFTGERYTGDYGLRQRLCAK
jgi:hypothetical protein